MAASESPSETEQTREALCSLPFLGATTVEDAVFYSVVGALGVTGLVTWPTAALISTAHALHQRARNVIRTGAVKEARAGLLEAAEEVL